MMAPEAKIYAEFGLGTLAVGGSKVDDPEVWRISIRELKEAGPIGTEPTKNTYAIGQTEIILSFPTENQMIATLAAFTNNSFEVVYNKWKAAQAEKEVS